MTFDLKSEIDKANQEYFSCPTCKGVRYKTCPNCKQPVNSYLDFREGRPAKQVYETRTEYHYYETVYRGRAR